MHTLVSPFALDLRKGPYGLSEAMSLIWKVFNRSIFVRDPAWDMVGSLPPQQSLRSMEFQSLGGRL